MPWPKKKAGGTMAFELDIVTIHDLDEHLNFIASQGWFINSVSLNGSDVLVVRTKRTFPKKAKKSDTAE